jgi:Ulp1 family protease
MEEKRIQYYDSLNKEGGNGEKYLNGILAYLQDEHKRQFKSDMDISGWSLVPSTKETPQQTKYNDENVYDCGVFVCLFADFIALDCAPIFDFDEEYINKCRELISLAIMNECAIDYNLND